MHVIDRMIIIGLELGFIKKGYLTDLSETLDLYTYNICGIWKVISPF